MHSLDEIFHFNICTQHKNCKLICILHKLLLVLSTLFAFISPREKYFTIHEKYLRHCRRHAEYGGRLGRGNCQSFPYLENVGDDDCHCFVLQLHYLRGEVGGRALPCSSAFVMMKSAHKENDEGGHNTDLITRLAGPLTISGG